MNLPRGTGRTLTAAVTPAYGFTVRFRAIHLFAALAVLIQCSPLRVCAVEKLALGANCHDRDAGGTVHRHSCDGGAAVADAGGGAAGHVPGDDDGHACVCDRPKHPTSGGKATDGQTTPALAPAHAWPHSPMLAPVGWCVEGAAPDPAPSPHAARQLPLLC